MMNNWVIGLGEYVKPSEFGNAIQTEMPSMSGNSGSPLATLDGTVVGLTYGGVNRSFDTFPPEPAEPVAIEEYPYQEEMYAQHERIETVEEYHRQWTE